IKYYGIVPENMYNMDEKGFTMGKGERCKVIYRRVRKNPRLTHDGSQEWVTVIEAVSAAGIVLPPMLINKGEAHSMGYETWLPFPTQKKVGLIRNSGGWSSSRKTLKYQPWSSNRLNLNWAKGKYRLLLLDGHTSHLTWEFFNFYLSHRVIPLCFPAHLTHLLQPLDVGLFGPLQHYYSAELDECIVKGEEGMNKEEFLQILLPARKRAYTENNILWAWEGAGIQPLNPRRVLDARSETKQSHTKKTSTILQTLSNNPTILHNLHRLSQTSPKVQTAAKSPRAATSSLLCGLHRIRSPVT
ncbi:DDE-domain-containing protein, partial [Choiromyces venosus 120613-1]